VLYFNGLTIDRLNIGLKGTFETPSFLNRMNFKWGKMYVAGIPAETVAGVIHKAVLCTTVIRRFSEEVPSKNDTAFCNIKG
jgi:hypothetical protein